MSASGSSGLTARITHNIRLRENQVVPSKTEVFEFGNEMLKLDDYYNSAGFYTSNDILSGFIIVTSVVQFPTHVAEKLRKDLTNYFQSEYQIEFEKVESVDLGKKKPSPGDKEFSVAQCLKPYEDFNCIFSTADNGWEMCFSNLQMHRHAMQFRLKSKLNKENKSNLKTVPLQTQTTQEPFGAFGAFGSPFIFTKKDLNPFNNTQMNIFQRQPGEVSQMKKTQMTNFDSQLKCEQVNKIRFPENSSVLGINGTIKTRHTLSMTKDFTKTFMDFSYHK